MALGDCAGLGSASELGADVGAVACSAKSVFCLLGTFTAEALESAEACWAVVLEAISAMITKVVK